MSADQDSTGHRRGYDTRWRGVGIGIKGDHAYVGELVGRICGARHQALKKPVRWIVIKPGAG